MRWKLVLDEGFECRAESVAVAKGRRRDGERKSGSPFGVETISERTPPHHPRSSVGIIKAYLAGLRLGIDLFSDPSDFPRFMNGSRLLHKC